MGVTASQRSGPIRSEGRRLVGLPEVCPSRDVGGRSPDTSGVTYSVGTGPPTRPRTGVSDPGRRGPTTAGAVSKGVTRQPCL